jgi:carboxymethylenebutenolidase
MDDMIQYQLKSKADGLSRRQFGALGLGAGLMSLLPPVANAAAVTASAVAIKTPDGTADAWFAHPATGAAPGVLIWPDIFGLRPAFQQMARKLAESGYSALVVNPFYRNQKAPTAPLPPSMADPAVRTTLVELMNSLTPATTAIDAKAFLAWLDRQPSVDKKRKMATTGYCMGGPLTMRTAAQFPDRIGAGASFHGTALATDQPDSPHLLIPKMKASYLVAIAANDDQRSPEEKNMLKAAFSQANLPHEIEVYVGAQHGWCPPDSQAHNPELAEKAWARMLAIFKTTLA